MGNEQGWDRDDKWNDPFCELERKGRETKSLSDLYVDVENLRRMTRTCRAGRPWLDVYGWT